MSTKSTIAYRRGDGGNGFHLYFDYADGRVHLSLTGDDLDFEASPRELRVQLSEGVLTAIADKRNEWESALEADEVEEND